MKKGKRVKILLLLLLLVSSESLQIFHVVTKRTSDSGNGDELMSSNNSCKITDLIYHTRVSLEATEQLFFYRAYCHFSQVPVKFCLIETVLDPIYLASCLFRFTKNLLSFLMCKEASIDRSINAYM